MQTEYYPGQIWPDTTGQPIQAHGGGILYHCGTYYWYGENKSGPTINEQRVDVIGVSCYSSQDLLNWKYEGIVLPAVPDDPHHDLHPSKVAERPKVIYNDRTGQFVMWLHIDTADYQLGHAGVAVADSPTGPFRYLGSMRPNGTESRDLTLFKDDDGSAYLIFGSGWHTHLHFARLSDDYLTPTGEFSTHFHHPGPPTGREAPALFKHQGQYFIITSGTTGWSPNASEYAMAPFINGPWTVKGNPCHGPDAQISWRAQSTFVFPVADRPGCFIAMFDRWNNKNLGDSRYVWLPVQFTPDGIEINWRDIWGLQDL